MCHIVVEDDHMDMIADQVVSSTLITHSRGPRQNKANLFGSK